MLFLYVMEMHNVGETWQYLRAEPVLFLYSCQWSDSVSKLSQYPKSGISSHCKKWNIYSESNLILVYVMVRETLLSYMLVMGKRKH